MLALILSVQLYAGGPIVRWRVDSCGAPMVQWLNAARAWADASHVEFTGAAGCGPGNYPPKGFVEIVPTEGKPYLLPE